MIHPILLTNDAEELEESLTDETATAEEPRPDEADELSSLCPGLLQPRCFSSLQWLVMAKATSSLGALRSALRGVHCGILFCCSIYI